MADREDDYLKELGGVDKDSCYDQRDIFLSVAFLSVFFAEYNAANEHHSHKRCYECQMLP